MSDPHLSQRQLTLQLLGLWLLEDATPSPLVVGRWRQPSQETVVVVHIELVGHLLWYIVLAEELVRWLEMGEHLQGPPLIGLPLWGDTKLVTPVLGEGNQVIDDSGLQWWVCAVKVPNVCGLGDPVSSIFDSHHPLHGAQ